MAELTISDLDTQLENVQMIMKDEAKKNAANMDEMRSQIAQLTSTTVQTKKKKGGSDGINGVH